MAGVQHEARENGGVELHGGGLEGPWVVVQKHKRNNKAKEKENMVQSAAVDGGGKKNPAKINATGSINGSRFEALINDNDEEQQETANHEENVTEPIRFRQVPKERENGKGKRSQNDGTIITNKKGSHEKGRSQSLIIATQSIDVDKPEKERNVALSCPIKTTNQEKNIKGTKLGARATGSFKGKILSKNNGRTTVENIVENIEKNDLANIFKEKFQQVKISEKNNESAKGGGGFNFQEVGLHVGLPMIGDPNTPRPPDMLVVPPSASVPDHKNEDTIGEGEIFEDANDQGSNMGSDSEMDIVRETPELS
jgi:hypothetical protein